MMRFARWRCLKPAHSCGIEVDLLEPCGWVVATFAIRFIWGGWVGERVMAARPAVHRLWPRIAITLALWFMAAAIFAAYLARFANYVATYAGLASAVTAI